MKIIKRLFNFIPQENKILYRFCKKYADKFNGENDGDLYTNGELSFLKKNIHTNNVVFDVGANVGEWSKLALKTNKGINIHCFEPSKATFKKLKENDFQKNVHINNFGLGSKNEKRTLYIFDDACGTNSLYERKGLESLGLVQTKKETVSLETLDGYCAKNKIKHIDFLKIDVEGHEMDVFKGAIDMLKKGNINIIQFEYGGCNIDAGVLLKDILEFFEKLDYDIYKMFPKKIRLIERYEPKLENFQYANYIVIKKGYDYL